MAVRCPCGTANIWDHRRSCTTATAVSPTPTDIVEVRSVCSLAPPASELLFDSGHPEGLFCSQAAVVDADIDGVQPSASISISEELRQVFLKTGASLSWQHAVMDVMRKYHPEVPKDPRTILRTPRSSTQKPVGGEVYIHLGLETVLCSLLKRELVDMIELQLHIDGLSPFKRSAMQLWPVLGRCLSLTNKQPF
ncbi:hypothetical protein EG68_12033, partial [Paragonimus skrjabini miyazakii]